MTEQAPPDYYFQNIIFNPKYYDNEVNNNITKYEADNKYIKYNTSNLQLTKTESGLTTTINDLVMSGYIGSSMAEKFVLPSNSSTSLSGYVLSILNASTKTTQWIPQTAPVTNYANYDNTAKTLISNVSGTPTTITDLVMSASIGSSTAQKFILPSNSSTATTNSVLTIDSTTKATTWAIIPTQISNYANYDNTAKTLISNVSGTPTTITDLVMSASIGSSTAQKFILPSNSSTATTNSVLTIDSTTKATTWAIIPTQISNYTNYNNTTKTLISNVSGTPTTITDLVLSSGIGSSLSQKFKLPTLAPQFTGVSLRVSSLSPLQTEWEIPQAVTPYVSYVGTNLVNNTALGSSNITDLVISNSINSSNVVSPKFNASSNSNTALDFCDVQQAGVANLFCNSSRTGNINISTTATTTTHNIYIGNNTANNQGITINSKYIVLGSLSTTSTITINRPINPNYSTNPGNVYSIGGVKEINIPATNVVSATPVTVASFTSQLGVYQVFYQIKYTVTVNAVNFTEQRVCLCDTINAINTVYNQMETLESEIQRRPIGDYIITGGGVWINNVSAIFSPIYLNVSSTFTNNPTLSANAYLRIVRIG